MDIERKLNEFKAIDPAIGGVAGFACPAEFWPALGYDGDARYVGIWWEQAGDEASWCDGRSTLVGADWGAYLALLAHNFPLGHPAHWLLGGSDTLATMWLIIDRVTEWAWLAPVEEAESVLRLQHPAVDAAAGGLGMWSLEEWAAIVETALAASRKAAADVDFAQMMAQQHERDRALAEALGRRPRPRPGDE